MIDQNHYNPLLNFTSECDLISLNTGGGESIQLVYEIGLESQVDDFQLVITLSLVLKIVTFPNQKRS